MRMLTLMRAALLCAALTPVHAGASAAEEHWYGGEYRDCDGSTVEIVECVQGLGDRWDARLNAAYRRMMDNESGPRQTALRDVQRKWIEYRDANCRYYAGGEGTIARIEAAVCTYVLTRDRAMELEMMAGE